MDAVRRLLPTLSKSMRKGACGRVCVVGGSAEYTGAPFFSAISCLRLGVDIVHVCAPPDAATVIKGYSPELIVHPSQELSVVEEWAERVDGVVVGPGLGRTPAAKNLVQQLLPKLAEKAVVIDADGLFALTEVYPNVPSMSWTILTPNAVELDRLCKKVLDESTLQLEEDELAGVVSRLSSRLGMAVLAKGEHDIFGLPSGYHESCVRDGSIRRPGGTGDILSGLLVSFLLWSKKADLVDNEERLLFAFRAASNLNRELARAAFAKHGRSMVAGDMVGLLGEVLSQVEDKNICYDSA